MNLTYIAELAAREMKGRASHKEKETGNKYFHGCRTARLAEQLAENIAYKGTLETIIVAAWFHDICNGSENHEVSGAEKTADLLKEHYPEKEIQEIYHYISLHDSRNKRNLSLGLQILQDADFLDHFGTFEIWNSFQYAFSKDIPMVETAQMILQNGEQQFREEIQSLHFEISKKLYIEKKEYVIQFVKRVLLEGQGGIVLPREQSI